MISTVEAAWLFTRGAQSVRIVRAAAPSGIIHLLVHGPGFASESRDFPDVVACMTFQAEFERRLVSQGFTLERFTSERRVNPRPNGTDRKRALG